MSNIQITRSTSVDNARSESVVLINPNNPQQIVASSKKFKDIKMYDFTLAVSFSTDGGRSWTEAPVLALPAGATIMSDPTFAWDDVGNVFLVGLIGRNPPSITAIGMVVYKSTNGGQTWSAPNLIHSSSSDDKQWAAGDTNPASPHHGNVYAVWHDGSAPAPMRFARSLDHGATWKSTGNNAIGAVSLTNDSMGPEISVTPDGTIYIFYLNGEFGGQIKFLKSTDGGNTFSASAVAASGITNLPGSIPGTGGFAQFPGTKFRVLTLATACTGSGNTVICAWADGREGGSTRQARIYYRRSLDGGTTWAGPPSGQPLLNLTFPPPTRHHFHPQLIGDPNGVIGCAFYELGQKLSPPRPLIDVIMAQSLDGGATFNPFTITDQPWDPALDAPLAHGNPNLTFIGDYFGLDASQQGFQLVWTDTRTGMQELWSDIVPAKRGSLWTKIAGELKHVSVGSSSLVWGVNSSDQIFRRDGNAWTKIPGILKQISIAADGTIWGVNASDEIFRRDGNAWTKIAGQLKYVSVGSSSLVWGVNSSNQIFRRDGNAWTKIPGILKQISIAADGTIWGVNSSDEIFRRDGNAWTKIPGQLKHVSAGSSSRVWGVNAGNEIFQRVGNAWTKIAGILKQISVAADGTIWGVNASDNIFEKQHQLVTTAM